MENKKIGWGSAWAVVAALGCSLLIPLLDIYIGNNNEFTFSSRIFWMIIGGAFAGFVCIGSGILYFFRNQRSYPTILAGILALSLSIWMQTQIWVDFFPGIQEHGNFNFCFLFLAFFSLLFWLAPFVAAFYLRHRISTYIWKIAVIVSVAQLAPVLVHLQHAPKADYEFSSYALDDKNKFEFASQDNVILIVVDCMGEKLFKEVLRLYPELCESFRDFTCFDRLESRIPCTHYAVPAMMTATYYSGDVNSSEAAQEHAQYLQDAFALPTSLPLFFRKNGYVCNAYPLLLQTVPFSPSYWHNAVPRIENQQSYGRLGELWAERQLPFFLKIFCTDSFFIFADQFVSPSENRERNVPFDLDFYRRLQAEFRVGTYPNGFKYLHLMGAHSPCRIDELLKENADTTRPRQLRGSLRCIETLIALLKKNGLYEKSTIVISGDHSEFYTPEIATLIKRPDAHGSALTFNSTRAQITEIAKTVLALKSANDKPWSLFDQTTVTEVERARDCLDFEKNIYCADWKPVNQIPEKEYLSASPELGTGMISGNFESAGRVIEVYALACRVEDGKVWRANSRNTAFGDMIKRVLVSSAGLPDGVYRIFIQSKIASVGEEQETDDYILSFNRYLYLKDGEAALTSRKPGIITRPLKAGETLHFQLWNDMAPVEYGDGVTLKEFSLRVDTEGVVSIHLPKNRNKQTAELSFAFFSSVPGILKFFHEDTLLWSGFPSESSNETTIRFTIPDKVETLKFRYVFERRFKNRDANSVNSLQLYKFKLIP